MFHWDHSIYQNRWSFQAIQLCAFIQVLVLFLLYCWLQYLWKDWLKSLCSLHNSVSLFLIEGLLFEKLKALCFIYTK